MNIKANETMWDAIETSIRETRIVQVGYDDRAVIGELKELSDTDGDIRWGRSVHEFWGTDEHGSEWRIHVLIEDVD